MMPDLSGFDVAAALKRSPQTASIPVIVLTAREVSAAEQASLHGKVAELLTKGPSAGARLVAAIQAVAGGG
jgi:CheY-like chemotaxis protein